MLVAPLRSAVRLGRIIADASNADKQVHIAHDLGEYQWRDFRQRQRLGVLPVMAGMIATTAGMSRSLGGIDAIKTHLVG